MALANQIGLSSKVVSERHYKASQAGKLTAGETASFLSKFFGTKFKAKEVVNCFQILYLREPEWHHSGFYKKGNQSVMGRTFFFSESDISNLQRDWHLIPSKIAEKKREITLKKRRKRKGFYFTWESDYNGRYGKKRNYKVLCTYDGNELEMPKGLTLLTKKQFEKAKAVEGKKYFGWDEPRKSEFE